MVLFLSDCHLGRGTLAESAAAEADLLALLDAHEEAVLGAGPLGGLVIAGDLFDQYIEYRHLVPKGFVRLQGRLAAWSDAGVPVLYAVGNRDPWHRSYFEEELGVRVFMDPVFTRVGGTLVYLGHGDGLIPEERVYNRIKPLLRNRFLTALYRGVPPADTGYGLARWVGRRSRGTRADGRPNPRTAEALKRHALGVLARSDARLAVLGHCHQEACLHTPDGTYLNPGFWFGQRTFGRLQSGRASLHAWTDAGPVALGRPAALDPALP